MGEMMETERNDSKTAKKTLTLACWAPWSLFLSSRSLCSFSSLRSGNFSTLVLLRRLTMGFSRVVTCIRLTYSPLVWPTQRRWTIESKTVSMQTSTFL
jgi:hypothetical protein